MNHVLVATPSYDDKVTSSYMASILEYIAYTNVNVSYTILPNDSLVTRMRNNLFTSFYENIDNKDFTHLLWQDSDVYVQGFGLERMLSFGVDVVGPAIPLKMPLSPYGISCAVARVYEEVEPFLYKAEYLGTGTMMLSKKAVVDLVKYCEENDQWYYDPEKDRKIYDVFRVGIDKSKIYQSEDWYLCELLRKIGYEIYIDSGSNTSHMTVKRRMMPINPESINRTYGHRLSNEEAVNFWTPNDWIHSPFEV
jgi:hypothetical protein